MLGDPQGTISHFYLCGFTAISQLRCGSRLVICLYKQYGVYPYDMGITRSVQLSTGNEHFYMSYEYTIALLQLRFCAISIGTHASSCKVYNNQFVKQTKFRNRRVEA